MSNPIRSATPITYRQVFLLASKYSQGNGHPFLSYLSADSYVTWSVSYLGDKYRAISPFNIDSSYARVRKPSVCGVIHFSCPVVAVKNSWIDTLKMSKAGRHAHHTNCCIRMDTVCLNDISSGPSTCSKWSAVEPQLSFPAFKHSNLSSYREMPTMPPTVTSMVQYVTAPARLAISHFPAFWY